MKRLLALALFLSITALSAGLYAAETAGPARGVTRLFYACPSGAELCGPTFTPDGRTLFVAIQHPGEDNGLAADAGSSFDKPGNRWPDFDPALPPRPSVVVITQVEGKEIGA